MEDRLRKATLWTVWEDPKDFLHDIRNDYHRDALQDQPNYVEVWCEKDALSGIFNSVLSQYQVVLNVGRGYDGWSSIKGAADRLMPHQESGKEVTVLYFGDFDPSGEDMHRSLQERLALLDVHPNMPKVALTHADARELPGDVAKAGDTRAAAFIAKYGEKAVELDALPVDELRGRIQREVEERLDLEALAESDRIEREQRRDLQERIDRMFEDNEQR